MNQDEEKEVPELHEELHEESDSENDCVASSRISICSPGRFSKSWTLFLR